MKTSAKLEASGRAYLLVAKRALCDGDSEGLNRMVFTRRQNTEACEAKGSVEESASGLAASRWARGFTMGSRLQELGRAAPKERELPLTSRGRAVSLDPVSDGVQKKNSCPLRRGEGPQVQIQFDLGLRVAICLKQGLG